MGDQTDYGKESWKPGVDPGEEVKPPDPPEPTPEPEPEEAPVDEAPEPTPNRLEEFEARLQVVEKALQVTQEA